AKAAEQPAAHHAVLADGSQGDAVRDLTDGRGANVVLDFVAERGAENDGWQMTGETGSYFVIGYGGELHIPTLDIITTERNVIGHIRGTHNHPAQPKGPAPGGKGTPHTPAHPPDAPPGRPPP